MSGIVSVIEGFTHFITTYIVPFEVLAIGLLGTGLFLTLRLGFIQLRRFKHGIEVTTGKFDNPDEPGDVTHFQALTTALSATVGVGNIAGVAAAIHWGGPGALFWMWVTAAFGMAVKYSEVTLALKYRKVEDASEANALTGTVSGGPMYYIERGLGSKWKPMAIMFALLLMFTSFMTGNAVQANTLSDQVNANFGIPTWITGLISAAFVGFIIFGGIKRIGRVTSVLAPIMAAVYIFGALIILGMNVGALLPAFGTILSEAFNPTSGVAGAGAGAFLMTLEWGIRRGLFSNEAGQGSAPIAHAAAQTDEPVSEGVVALLEPFIDTLIICTITGLVIITTGVWNTKHPTPIILNSGDISFRQVMEGGIIKETDALNTIQVVDGKPQYADPNGAFFCWHEASVDEFFTDEAQTIRFTGTIDMLNNKAIGADGSEMDRLYGDASETAAPLTSVAFSSVLGLAGQYIVMACVLLFAVSTAISWSYYGDRCAGYVFGKKALIPFKGAYLVFHFLGATAPLAFIWDLGDVFLSMVTLPNLLALVLLSGIIARESKSYFDREPWLKNTKQD